MLFLYVSLRSFLLKISRTAEPIRLCISRNIHTSPVMVLIYFILFHYFTIYIIWLSINICQLSIKYTNIAEDVISRRQTHSCARCQLDEYAYQCICKTRRRRRRRRHHHRSCLPLLRLRKCVYKTLQYR